MSGGCRRLNGVHVRYVLEAGVFYARLTFSLSESNIWLGWFVQYVSCNIVILDDSFRELEQVFLVFLPMEKCCTHAAT